MDEATQQFNEGDLVVDLREHSPRVGRVKSVVAVRKWLSIEYSKGDHFGDGMAEASYVPFSVVRHCEDASVGQRVDRRAVISADDDIAPRLPNGLALYEIAMFAAGPLREYNDVGLYIDSKFTADEAEYFFDTQGTPVTDEQKDQLVALRAAGKLYTPYTEFPWSPKQRKALDAENARRKKLAELWSKRRSEAAERLKPFGGAVLSMKGWFLMKGWLQHDEFACPVVWYLAISEELEGELLAFLSGLRLSDVDWGIRRIVDPASADLTLAEPVNGEVYEPHDGSAPRDGETAGQYAARVAIDETHFRAALNAFRRSGGNVGLFAALMRSHSGRNETVQFVIDGLLPRQAVALLIGPPKIGKSTLALQAAVDVADGAPFLGLATQPASSDALVVFLSGEDPQSVVETRLRSLSIDGQNGRLLPICDQSSMLKALEIVETVPVDLLVVDTAAAFVGASVNDTGPSREFMATLAEFAKRKNCAVLVIHHTNKGISPRSSKATLDGMKGSSEFTSAARVVLTIHAEGDQRVLGVAMHNMPSSVSMLPAPLRLTYDRATERHELHRQANLHACAAPVALRRDQGERETREIPQHIEAVAAVIRRAKIEGRPVALSGKNEPYNYGAPEIAGLTRAQVRAAHRAAIVAGLIDGAAESGRSSSNDSGPQPAAAE